MQKIFISRLIPALATFLMVVPAVQAQAPAAPKSVWVGSFDYPRKAVIVTVDYLDIPLTDFLKVSQWIPSGHDSDGLLLAALVKAGAQDTLAAQIQALDKMGGSEDKILRETDLGATVVLDLDTGKWTNTRAKRTDLMSYAEATPQFNPDGTVTVRLRLILGPPPTRYPAPASSEGYQFAEPTFHDGQTLMIGNSVTRSAVGASKAHLTFVRVQTTADMTPNQFLSDIRSKLPSGVEISR